MQPTSVGLLWYLREGVILGIDQRVCNSRFNYPLGQTSGRLQPMHLGNVD